MADQTPIRKVEFVYKTHESHLDLTPLREEEPLEPRLLSIPTSPEHMKEQIRHRRNSIEPFSCNPDLVTKSEVIGDYTFD